MSERAYKAGRETSEFLQVRLAQRVGVTVLATGVVTALAGAVLALWHLVAAGAALAYVGGELLEKTVAAYTGARATVKASASAPPPVSVFNSNTSKPPSL